MLLGDVLNGNDAFLMGMVDYVVKDRKDLDNKVLEIMQKSRKMLSKCNSCYKKNLINLNYNIDAHHAAKLFSECIIHKEGHEGFQSFEKENHFGIQRTIMKLNNEHKALFDTVKNFAVNEIKPFADEWEKNEKISRSMNYLKKWETWIY